jgi:hypothetical protein
MLWFILFFVCVSYEVWAGINHGARSPMLTQVVVRYIPWPFTMAFIVWLFCHFAVRYASPAYRAWLRSGGAGG